MPNQRSGSRAGDTRNIQRVARWLTLAVGLLILYGSLFPFQFTFVRHFHLLAALRSLHFQRPSRGDLVANILLYMPLGLCLLRAWPGRWSRVVVYGLTVVCSTLLSLAIELLQTLESTRVASLTDVAANTTGTALGAVVGLLYGSIGAMVQIPGVAHGQAAPVPLAILALWLAFRLAPFVPTIDWQKYKDALKPLLLHPQLTAQGVLRYTVGWLVIVVAVRQLWKPECVVAAVASLMAIVLLGRLVVVGHELSINEMVAMALVVPVGFVLRLLPEHVQRLLIALGLAAVISLQGLEPFHFVARTRPFSWIPFQSSLSGHIEVNYLVFIGKCFWYSSLVWCVAHVGVGVRAATLTTALFLLTIEILQVRMSTHSAEITDPLLAIMAGLLIARMDTGTVHKSPAAAPVP